MWQRRKTSTTSQSKSCLTIQPTNTPHTHTVIIKHYITPNPVSHSQVLYMTNIQVNKLHLFKSRFKQICLKTLFFLKSKHIMTTVPPPPPPHVKHMSIHINTHVKILLYSQASLNRPIMGPTLNGPFMAVIGLGSKNIVIMDHLVPK